MFKDLISSYIYSICGVEVKTEYIELMSGDFKTNQISLTISTSVNNYHLIKDKLIKDSHCQLLDSNFKFISNDFFKFSIRIDINSLKDKLNKPAVVGGSCV
jgi:hypothetical protein